MLLGFGRGSFLKNSGLVLMYLTPQAVAELADVPGSGLVTQAGS